MTVLRLLALSLSLLAVLLPMASRADEVSVEERMQQAQEVETVYQSVNGSGYYCRGCATMVEAVHEHILSTVDRWSEPGFTIEVQEFLNEHCAAAAERGDEEQIQRACSDLKGYGGVIGARHFGASVPSDSALYSRTLQICTDELGVCYAAPPAPKSLRKKKSRHASMRWCAGCATIAVDLHDVLTRRDQNDAYFLSGDHVRKVVDAQCASLPRRFAGGRPLSRVEEICEELEDGGALRRLQDAWIGAAPTGLTADFVLGHLCGSNNEDLEGDIDCGPDDALAKLAWRSPFATTKMSAAASQACERASEEEDSSECKISKFAGALMSGVFLDMASASADDLEPEPNYQKQNQQQLPKQHEHSRTGHQGEAKQDRTLAATESEAVYDSHDRAANFEQQEAASGGSESEAKSEPNTPAGAVNDAKPAGSVQPHTPGQAKAKDQHSKDEDLEDDKRGELEVAEAEIESCTDAHATGQTVDNIYIETEAAEISKEDQYEDEEKEIALAAAVAWVAAVAQRATSQLLAKRADTRVAGTAKATLLAAMNDIEMSQFEATGSNVNDGGDGDTTDASPSRGHEDDAMSAAETLLAETRPVIAHFDSTSPSIAGASATAADEMQQAHPTLPPPAPPPSLPPMPTDHAMWLNNMRGVTRLKRAKIAAGGDVAWSSLSDLEKHKFLEATHMGHMSPAT